MPESYSLLEFVRQLGSDDELRADFAGDPHGVLADHGLDGLAAEDVRDALGLVEDIRTVEFGADPGSFDGGSDAAVRLFAEYAGLPTGGDGFEVDHTGDIDDLDGYPAPSPPVDDAEIVPETGTGFGEGFDHARPQVDSGADAHDVTADAGRSLHDPQGDPAFDETGVYDEFDVDGAAFGPPHGIDEPPDGPDHPH